MGYRLLVVFMGLLFITSCAAMDNDALPNTDGGGGVSPSENVGKFGGYFVGKTTVEKNDCVNYQGMIGDEADVSFDVLHAGEAVDVTFPAGVVGAGTLGADGNVTVMVKQGAISREVYYLKFAEVDKTVAISGSVEIIEDEAGQLNDPCASLSLAMTKAEKKPASDGAKK